METRGQTFLLSQQFPTSFFSLRPLVMMYGLLWGFPSQIFLGISEAWKGSAKYFTRKGGNSTLFFPLLINYEPYIYLVTELSAAFSRSPSPTSDPADNAKFVVTISVK